jgi:hypothetical protein
MKKLKLLTIAVLVFLLAALTGCSNDVETLSMTFVDILNSPAKEFTIDSNFAFKVTFISPNAVEQAYTIQEGDIITGKITEADAAWNNNLTGVAAKMTSTNTTLNSIVPVLEIAISLTYTKSGEEITAVTVNFPDNGFTQAETMMGGTYLRKF